MYDLEDTPVTYWLIDGGLYPIDKEYAELGEKEGWLVYRRTVFKNGTNEMQFDFRPQ